MDEGDGSSVVACANRARRGRIRDLVGSIRRYHSRWLCCCVGPSVGLNLRRSGCRVQRPAAQVSFSCHTPRPCARYASLCARAPPPQVPVLCIVVVVQESTSRRGTWSRTHDQYRISTCSPWNSPRTIKDCGYDLQTPATIVFSSLTEHRHPPYPHRPSFESRPRDASRPAASGLEASR